MKSYNNFTIIGRAVNDATSVHVLEVQDLTSRMVLAVDRPYKDSDGKHPIDFLNIVAHGNLAKICSDYVKQGALVMVCGRIQSRSYTVNDETKWVTELIADSLNVLEYKKEEAPNG